MKRRHVLVLALFGVGAVAAGCGSGGGSPSAGAGDPATTAAAASTVAPARSVVVDVRTPAEYATGHLQGAINLSVDDGTLAEALAGMDKAATYRVYCHSGRRATIAATLMASHGFGHIVNLGAIGDAAATTGLPIVTT